MKINQNTKSSKKKWIVLLIVLVFLAAGALFAYKYLKKANDASGVPDTRPVNSVDYSPATKTEQNDAAIVKENTIKNSENTSTPQTSQSDISILISRAGQSGPSLPIAVRTLITGKNSGTCDMTFKKGGATVTKTFDIKYEATSSTCNGDIEVSNFNESGDWSLTVSVGDKSVQSEGAIHVQK